jgi:hypothetical protein
VYRAPSHFHGAFFLFNLILLSLIACNLLMNVGLKVRGRGKKDGEIRWLFQN